MDRHKEATRIAREEERKNKGNKVILCEPSTSYNQLAGNPARQSDNIHDI